MLLLVVGLFCFLQEALFLSQTSQNTMNFPLTMTIDQIIGITYTLPISANFDFRTSTNVAFHFNFNVTSGGSNGAYYVFAWIDSSNQTFTDYLPAKSTANFNPYCPFFVNSSTLKIYIKDNGTNWSVCIPGTNVSCVLNNRHQRATDVQSLFFWVHGNNTQTIDRIQSCRAWPCP